MIDIYRPGRPKNQPQFSIYARSGLHQRVEIVCMRCQAVIAPVLDSQVLIKRGCDAQYPCLYPFDIAVLEWTPGGVTFL